MCYLQSSFFSFPSFPKHFSTVLFVKRADVPIYLISHWIFSFPSRISTNFDICSFFLESFFSGFILRFLISLNFIQIILKHPW